MATMLPPSLGRAEDQPLLVGEAQVYEQLRLAAPSDWIVLHSLRLKAHSRKKTGEADFVVITTSGVLVLEVKGGINRRNTRGEWIQEKKGYPERRKNESPFDQAMGAYFAIESFLRDSGRGELIHRIAWGWGVVMPHCMLEVPDDSGVDPEMLLDQRHFPEGLIHWIEQLIEYWRQDYRKKNRRKIRAGYDLQRRLPPQTCLDLKNMLKPRFENYEGLGQNIREAEQSLIRLTNQQIRLLAAVRSPDTPRAIVEGAAGTGKTLLAFEFAKECAAKGESVLFVCFNHNLARLLREKAPKHIEPGCLTIENYHQLVASVRREAGLSTSFSSDWGDFNRRCFDLVAEALDALGRDSLFDRLVIDEGQDLMSAGFLSVLDLVLKGGIFPPSDDQRKGGKWFLALDRSQTLYSENFHPDQFEKIQKCCGSNISLTENCRNTRPIATTVYAFSNAGSCDVIEADGPEPVIDYYAKNKDLEKLLRSYINDMIAEHETVDMPVSEIVVLSAKKDRIPSPLLEPGALKKPLKRYPDSNRDSVVWETIHGFKGLEASTIILIGLEDIDLEEIKQLVYVGGSRAKAQLIWLLPESQSATVQAHSLGVMEPA